MLIKFIVDYNLSLSRTVRAGDTIDCDATLATRLMSEGVAVPSYTLTRAVEAPIRQSNTLHASKGVVDFSGTFFKGNTNFTEVLDLPCGVDAISLGMTSEATDVSTYANIKLYAQTTDFSGPGGGANQNAYLGGVAQTLVPFTFAGAASPTFVAGSYADPVNIWTDYLPVNNTGPGPSGLVRRSYYPSGVAAGLGYGKVDLYGGRSAVLQAQSANYHSFYGSFVGADIGAVSNTALFTASIAIDPVLIRFATQRKVDSVIQFGDSTREGWKADGTVAAIERWARKRSAAGRPTAFMNQAVQGQTTSEFVTRLERMAAAGIKCDVLVYQVASPNDDGGTHTAATSAKQINNGHRAVRAAATMGAKLLLDGPFPMSAGTPSAGTRLCIDNAKQFMLSMAALNPNIQCAFYDELHDPAVVGKWKAIYNASGDGLHENELAVTAVIEPIQGKALNAMLG